VIDPELLKSVPIFQSLPPEELVSLAGVMREETLAPGKRLFEVGDAGSTMYVVKRGLVQITIPSGGAHVELTRVGPNEFFGELALLDTQARSARATTLEETELYGLSRESFLEFVRPRPLAALAMLAYTARRLRTTTEMVRTRASSNLNEELRKKETFTDRISDKIAEFGGSWRFIFFYCGLVFFWMAINTAERIGIKPFDEPPYQGLNLVLGIIATLQAPFIMMSQNRDQARERLRAEADYRVNLKNEIGVEKTVAALEDLKREIAELKSRLDEVASARP
jgi:CRP/FNR family cyclic AMP-dependent transcriptional regulator